MPVKCNKCGVVEANQPYGESGIECSVCHHWYHLRCIEGRTLRSEGKCDACSAAESSADEIAVLDDDSVSLPAPTARSTILPPSDNDRDLRLRIRELELLLEESRRREQKSRILDMSRRHEEERDRTIGSLRRRYEEQEAEGGEEEVPLQEPLRAPLTATILNRGAIPRVNTMTNPSAMHTSNPSAMPMTNPSAIPNPSMTHPSFAPHFGFPGCPPQQRPAATTETFSFQHQSGYLESQSHGSSLNVSMERSQWRSRLPQQVLNRSAAPPPLTKEQMMRRKTMNTVLPKFDGNPLKWLPFINAYLSTGGAVCGFTAAEDMERLRAALHGPARELVGAQMDNVENLDGIIGSLQLSFGQTHLILATMTEKVNAMPALKSDLSNVASFGGAVDQLRSINRMMDGCPHNPEVVQKLVRKLPLHYAEEWLRYKQANPPRSFSATASVIDVMAAGTLDQMADYLLHLHERMVTLGRNLPTSFLEEAPKKKALVMVTQEEESVADDPPVVEAAPVSTLVAVNAPATARRRRGNGRAKAHTEPAPDQCHFKCGAGLHSWSLCPKFKELAVQPRWNVVKQEKRCFMCLGDHHRAECSSTAKCNVDDCGRPHHPLLHPVGEKVEVFNCVDNSTPKMQFKVLPVNVSYGSEERRILAFLDSGSTTSFIEGQLAKEMGMRGTPGSLSLMWVDGELQPPMQSERVQIKVANVSSGETFSVEASTHGKMRLPECELTRATLLAEGLDHLEFTCFERERPRLVIGQDHASLRRALESFAGRSPEIVASRTPLGYVIEGERTADEVPCLVASVASDHRMEAALRKFIDGEHFGLRPDDDVVVESVDNQRARAMMETCTSLAADGRYVTGLLWRDETVVLPDNRREAENRFLQLEKKLKNGDPALREKVMDQMRGHLEKKYVRQLEEETIQEQRAWYLPVFNHGSDPTGKVRLVFDCAATKAGVSLNSKLLSGPDLTTPLVNVLMRFRRGRVGVSGDLQDMFHRVHLREEDRWAQRFVWRWSPEEKLSVFEMVVLTFGATCSPSLAQYVKNLNAERFRAVHPQAVEAIQDEHYVDDWLGCGDSEEEALQLAKDVRHIHGQGGFQMHKWVSNSAAVLRGIGELAPETEVSLANSKILGMIWNTSNDCLSYRFRRDEFLDGWLDGRVPPTKRIMLSVVMKIYDPLGLVSHHVIEGKIILREAWREKAGWDDPLCDGIKRRWTEWCDSIAQLQEVAVPRWHGTTGSEVDLHVFVDASETAIAACCYVVQKTQFGIVRSLCVAKTNVTPIRTKSIPRLELDAAVLGVRVMAIVRKANIWRPHRVTFWTDAKDVLWWLRSNERRYSPYVANRVATIINNSEVDQWRWTPTDQNPADWGTKWTAQRGDDSLWWRGPDFLAEDEESWPNCVQEPDRLLEIRPLMTIHAAKTRGEALVPDVARISKWTVLVRATAYAYRFVAVLRRRDFPGPLTETNLLDGEAAVFRLAQRDLDRTGRHADFLAPLSPFLDERGVLRMRRRTELLDHLTVDARYPVIIPEDHPATLALISHYHHQGNHQNTTAVINELRQRVVMPHMKAAVKRVVANCYMCAMRRARPLIPEMSALPLCRLAAFLPPFAFTGVDYFGPYNVKRGRTLEKRWGALFTCLTTRAIYLEVVYSLSGQSCVAAIDSLVTRRGLPLEIHSDNATCFVAASKQYVGPNGRTVRWRFVPPRTPTMAGAWERLVGVTKRALEGLEMPNTPTEEGLRHLFSRAERLVNSRPLTEIAVDYEEEEALTPNHFLLGSSSGIRPEADLSGWNPHRALEEWSDLVNAFWTRWTREYLPLVAARSKWRKTVEPLKEGDLVYLCDTDYRKGWMRAVVIKTFPDPRSGQVRQLLARTSDGKEYRRGATGVAPILRMNKDSGAIDDH